MLSKNKQLTPPFKVTDLSVSNEEFELVLNQEYGYLETRPKPELSLLPNYYKSEDYISHSDSKRNLFEKSYHLVRKIALKHKVSFINSISSSNKNLLDIGCGTGDFLRAAQKHQWHVTGIEPNQSARNIANQKTKQRVFDTDQLLKLDTHTFDVITLWHVFEHLSNPESQIKQLKRLLKPNGILLIAVPNYKSFDAIHYKRFWAAFDVPRHLYHFCRSSVDKLVSKQDMTITRVKPLIFDAFYISLLSEKYKHATLYFLRAFFIGLLSNIRGLMSREYSSLLYVIKNN